MIWFFSKVIPGERIWHNMKMRTIVHKKIDRMLQWTVLACFALTGIMIILSPYIWTYLDDTVRSMFYLKAGTEPPHPTYYIIPLIVLSAGLTPLIWPSIFVMDKEGDIIKRDQQYPAFIRSLGGSVGARSRSYALPLKKLRIHDFGPLKKNIDDLYKRLTVRIKTERAWEYFAAETLSELISKFNEMYVEGSKTGDTKKISNLISDNFVRLNGLRELKYESGSTYLWMLYGLTVSMSFLMFFGLYIVEEFTLLFRDLQMPREGAEQSGLFFFQFNESLASIPVLWLTCCIVLVLHCAFSALMVKTITGSHKVTAGLHFVGMMWASTITAIVVMYLAQALMA